MERAFMPLEYPAPLETAPGESDTFEAPIGELECAIARIWSEVLELEKVGRNGNFFELGGDSITGMELAEALCAQLDLELPVVTVFQNPTVRELAQLIATDLE